MVDERDLLLVRALHAERIARAEADAWMYLPPARNWIRWHIAQALVALALRLAPTITLPQTGSVTILV